MFKVNKKNYLAKLFSGYSIMLFLGVVVYVIVSLLFGSYKIRVAIVSNNCENFSARADVLEIGSSSIYKRDLTKIPGGDLYEADFPLRSKILSISFCPESRIFLDSVGLQIGKRIVSLGYQDSHWYCTNCEIDLEDDKMIASSGQLNPELETSNITESLPGQWYLLFLFLRYFPYLVLSGFLVFILFMSFSTKLIFLELSFHTGILLFIFFSKHALIRNLFSPAKISTEKTIGQVHYRGLSIKADLILILFYLLLPLLIYMLIRTRDKILKNNILKIQFILFFYGLLLTLILNLK